MKSLVSAMLLTCLLMTGFVSAQDNPPLIAYKTFGEIYALRDGEDPELLSDTAVLGALLSPDGQHLAYTSLAAYDANRRRPKNRYDPSNLSILNIADKAVTPLWTQGETEPGILIFGRWKTRSVKTLGRRGGGGYTSESDLYADLAWSPDSRYLAQLQTVMGEERSALTRLAIFDVTTGEMTIIARLGSILDEVGYGIFWFEEGIVLYSDLPGEDANDTITVMDPEGNTLYTWDIERKLNFENPIHHEGKNYLNMGWEYIYDVSTNELIRYEGTIAAVSAVSPETSLIVEDCPESQFQPVWDIYSSSGDKLLRMENTTQPVPAPDGQEVAYVTYNQAHAVSVLFFDGENASFYQPETEKSFFTQNLIWGPKIYTLTPVGAEECLRHPMG